MNSLFYVENVYCDKENIRLVLDGKVIRGKVYINMTLLIPLNNSTNVSVKVDSVNELGFGEAILEFAVIMMVLMKLNC